MPKSGVLFFLILLMTIAITPSHAFADTISGGSAPDCSANGQYYQNYQGFLNKQADAKAKAITNVHNQLSKIQADLYFCLDGIDIAYALGPLLHDPLGFLTAAVEAMFWKIVDTIIIQVCMAITSTVNSIINQIAASVESLANFACIPLPSLGLSGINLGLPKVPCKGTSLLGNNAILTQTPTSSGSSASMRLLGRQSE